MDVQSGSVKKTKNPFRRAVLRGLAVSLPPLLTIVFFLWAWNLIESYVLVPVENISRTTLVYVFSGDIHDETPAGGKLLEPASPGMPQKCIVNDKVYVRLKSGRWIPQRVYDEVVTAARETIPVTAEGFYRNYVDLHFLRRSVVIPVFLSVFVLVMYLLGKFMAAGAGRIFHNWGEIIIRQLPIIRNVYSAVKQVTDFVFSEQEQETEFKRVVAVEYPRKGVWSVGFVTGESMSDIRSAANEPVLSVLMPTSPMPATGFTITVLKSETVDLNISLDQAIQFVVSCGVVVPPEQMQKTRQRIDTKISAAIAGRAHADHGAVDEDSSQDLPDYEDADQP